MSPFDAARYARLLEGLEAAEVRLSSVRTATSTLRFDPEYFQTQHLNDEALISARAKDFVSFADLGLEVDASAFYPSIEGYYGEGDLPFLRVADVDSIIDFEGCTLIPETLCEIHTTLARVFPGDILLTKGGSVARVGLVTQMAAASRDLIFLNSSKLSREDQAFLYLYSQTQFFNRVLLRSSSQTAQPHLTITLVRELRVLNASWEMKSQALSLVDAAFNSLDLARKHQADTENSLLRELGLMDWQAPEPLSYIRQSSDAFAAGRVDAEYFSPRVRELMALLGRDGLTIGKVAPVRHEIFNANKAGKKFSYIEIGDMRTDGTVEATELDTAEAPSRATQHVRAGDVLTSTVRPIRRLSAAVDSKQDGAVCSSGFVVLCPIDVSTSTLVTYLRLPLVCELMDLHTSASLYPAISERDLLSLPIPRIPQTTQQAVDQQVEAAHASKQRATQLLEAAKRAVEIAIEDSEAAALKYLEAFK
jgi:type I restriction enzyme S subunit